MQPLGLFLSESHFPRRKSVRRSKNGNRYLNCGPHPPVTRAPTLTLVLPPPIQITDTHDLYDNKAQVIQQEDMKQFVFSYRCAKNKGKCVGISPMYESECTERNGWMYMYYKPENKPAQWGFVNGKSAGLELKFLVSFGPFLPQPAPHHCACRLKPKFYHPTMPSDEPSK